MSNDIASFVRRLVSLPPSDPHSVHLEVDVDGDPVALFEVLLMIMTNILKTWYTPPIQMGQISQAHTERLIAYFASFGIAIHIQKEELPRVLHIDNKAYEHMSDLKQMIFQMADSENLYTVRFSFL